MAFFLFRGVVGFSGVVAHMQQTHWYGCPFGLLGRRSWSGVLGEASVTAAVAAVVVVIIIAVAVVVVGVTLLLLLSQLSSMGTGLNASCGGGEGRVSASVLMSLLTVLVLLCVSCADILPGVLWAVVFLLTF